MLQRAGCQQQDRVGVRRVKCVGRAGRGAEGHSAKTRTDTFVPETRPASMGVAKSHDVGLQALNRHKYIPGSLYCTLHTKVGPSLHSRHRRYIQYTSSLTVTTHPVLGHVQGSHFPPPRRPKGYAQCSYMSWRLYLEGASRYSKGGATCNLDSQHVNFVATVNHHHEANVRGS